MPHQLPNENTAAPLPPPSHQPSPPPLTTSTTAPATTTTTSTTTTTTPPSQPHAPSHPPHRSSRDLAAPSSFPQQTNQTRLKSQPIQTTPAPELAPAVQKCGKCELQMKGAFVRALGGTYHLECFKCMVRQFLHLKHSDQFFFVHFSNRKRYSGTKPVLI